MSYFDDLREKNKKTLNDKEKLYRNTTQKSTKTMPQNTQKKQIPVNTTRGRKNNKSQNKHKLDEGAKKIQEKAIKENAFPQAMVRFNERVLNDGVLAPVSIPYQITTGKRLLDFGFEADSDSARKGAAVGNFAGTAAAYGLGYGAAGKMIGKGAGKLLATDAGKKATAKIIASKAGQKAGKEAAEKVAEGIARNIVGDATVGTLMNLSDARGRGLEGKELATDMAINAAFDAVLGTGFEFAPMAWQAGKNAIKNTKVEPRLVGGKVKNVRVRQIPQNTYKVSRSGNVNERLGARTANETIGAIPQETVQDIPHAKRAFAPETQKKVFDAVEKRSGAKITFADLPEGVDGTYQNGVITISNKASNPAYTVLKHELTHHIETSGHYAELSDFIQSSMRDAGYNVDQSINDIISDYARMGKTLTNEEAQKEFTAKFAEEYLFNSEKSIERLARENPNVFQQIYDWIIDTIHKIGASEETKFLIDAQRKYEKALRTVGKTEDAGIQYMFHKASAEDALKAEQMKNAGASEAEIKKRLNLHQDARGEWVSELSDQGAKLYRGFDAKLYNANPDYRRYADMWKTGDILSPEFAKLDEIYRNVAKNEGNLDQILDHEALFEKYPQLRRTSVRFENLEEGINGGFNPYTKQIVLSEDLHGDDTMSTLLHEVQHNVQTLDGRNNGNTVAFAADNIKARQRFAQRQEEEASNALETLVGEPLGILMTQAKQSGIREDIDSMWEAEDICRAMRKHFENIGDTAAVERVDAFTKLYADLTDRVNKSFKEVLYWKGTSPTEAYLKTSGEVEARQTASSRFFSEQDRRNRVPEKGIDLEGAGYSQNYVGTRSDGIEVYETSPEVKNLPTKEKINLFKQNMTEKYRGRTARFTKNGETHYAKFDDADVKKNIYGDKKSDKNGKKAKLNTGADGDTFDLIENSTYQSNSTEKGKIGSAHEGVENWDYYIKSVQIDGKVFDEVVNIRVKQNGEYVYSIQLNQNKKTPALPPAPAYNDKSQMATLKIGETTDAMDSIEPGAQNVKRKTESSTGRSLQKDELLNRLQKASENLYGETGNKYLRDIPPVQAKKGPQSIPYADRKKQFVKDLQGVITGETPTGKILTVMDTPEQLKRYGIKANVLTMTQDTARKAMYPQGYQGLEKGHNLGFGGLEMLPEQLENPIAILDSFSQKDAKVIVTNMLDEHNNPVIAAIHLDKKGRIEYTDEIASVYGRKGYEEFINRARSEGKVLYENKKIGLDAVPSVGLQLPGANHSSDPMNIIAHKLDTVKEKPQPIPHADTIPKARSVASEAPDITSSERWDYMLENAPGERHARKLTDEEWNGAKTYADDRFRADSGISKREAEVLYAEPRTEVKETKKGQQYERRKIRETDKEVREALGANKYSDGPYIKKRMDETVEKMKTGSLSKAEKDKLFDEMFANGIKIDTEFATHYQDLKKTLRETPIKVSEGIRKNITDFKDFRRNNMNKIRLNDHEGVQADIFYDELRSEYPELFPELNTPEEMVEKIAEVADGIKTAEKRVSEDIFSEEIYTEAKKRFEEVMDNLEKEVSIVKRHSEKHSSDITLDQMEELIGSLGKFKRQAEKVKSKVILNDEDRILKEQLLQGRLTPETLRKNNLNANNILKVYEAEKPAYELEKALKKLGNKTKEGYRETARSLLEGSGNWKEKKVFRGARYVRETPERNFIDIAGKEDGEKLIKEYITPIHEHEAAAMRMKNELREEVRKLKISDKAYDLSDIDIDAPGLAKKDEVTEAALVQLYGEKLIRKEDLEFIGADVTKIENAVNTMRGIYNQLIEKANNELIRHGYEPIEFRKDYFPHFMEDKSDGMLEKIGERLGIQIQSAELPTDIAGLTKYFKPGKRWFGNALQRNGAATEYNAVKGFDLYIEGISDIIYHTEDIQKLRNLSSEIRFHFSDGGIKEQIKEIRADEAISDFEKDERIKELCAKGNTRFGSFATWLDNYTNGLAGKKDSADRYVEDLVGRGFYNISKQLENKIAGNMVAINPASWATNFIPLVQAGELSPKYVLEGMSQTISNKFRKIDNIADLSTFLTNRRGSDMLWKSKGERRQDILTRPMQMIDNFTSEALVRAKYAEQIKKGVNPEEAMRKADRLAAGVIADRSKGALPTIFNAKNPVFKTFTMFQVEVNNQWSYLFKDIPKSKENVAQVAMAFTNYAIGAYIFNDVYERFVGRRPALDPLSWINDYIGDTTGKKVPNFTEALEAAMKGEGINLEATQKKKAGDADGALIENVEEQIPFISGVLTEGGRLPISSAIPDLIEVGKNLRNLHSGDIDKRKAWSTIGKELAKPATYLITPVGGGQAKKAIESTMAFAKGGSYGLDNDGNEKLRFAVDKDPLSVINGLAFGQYSIGNSGDYVESGFKMLSVDKTKAYKALTAAGVKNTEAEKFIRSLPDSKTEMRKAIMNSKLTSAQKNAVGRVLDDHSPDYTSQNSFTYSQMSDKEKKAIDNLTKYGMTQKKAEKAYNAQKDYSSQTEKANALLEAGYHDGVLKALGLGEKGITGGKALHSAGLDNTAYQYTRKNADKNDNGSISIEEAKKYLDKTSYSRKQKYALVKALTDCKDSNNPYR